MKKYYTRACNFFYGSNSSEKVKKKISLPLNGSNLVSFDSIEIFLNRFEVLINTLGEGIILPADKDIPK